MRSTVLRLSEAAAKTVTAVVAINNQYRDQAKCRSKIPVTGERQTRAERAPD